MIKKTRTILFFICLILFILIAPIIVLYSQGFRFDFSSKKITQTGGIFLDIEPKQAEIYLDGKLIKKTDFLFGSALIKNLIPKKYQIRLAKEGYYSWEKNLEVKAEEVTEAKSVVLIVQNPDFTILSKGVENFWPSMDENKIVLKEKDEQGWTLKLYDLTNNVKSYLIGEKEINSRGADLLNLEWGPSSKELYLTAGIKEDVKSFSLQLDKIPPALTGRKIPPIPGNIIVSQKFNNDIYYLDDSGYIFKSDSSFLPKERMNETAFPVQQETEYKLLIFPDYIFIKEGQNLYLFNRDSKSFEKFFDQVNDLKISPDLGKLVYFSNSEIWVLFLKDDLSQPQRKAGEKLFIIRLSEKIKDVFWLNSNYLIFSAGDKIKITEIDDRDRINIYDLKDFKEPRIFFNATDNKLYVLTENNLYSSINLLP